jgi:hypothetical protein
MPAVRATLLCAGWIHRIGLIHPSNDINPRASTSGALQAMHSSFAT